MSTTKVPLYPLYWDDDNYGASSYLEGFAAAFQRLKSHYKPSRFHPDIPIIAECVDLLGSFAEAGMHIPENLIRSLGAKNYKVRRQEEIVSYLRDVGEEKFAKDVDDALNLRRSGNLLNLLGIEEEDPDYRRPAGAVDVSEFVEERGYEHELPPCDNIERPAEKLLARLKELDQTIDLTGLSHLEFHEHIFRLKDSGPDYEIFHSSDTLMDYPSGQAVLNYATKTAGVISSIEMLSLRAGGLDNKTLVEHVAAVRISGKKYIARAKGITFFGRKLALPFWMGGWVTIHEQDHRDRNFNLNDEPDHLLVHKEYRK